jgi:hypothetical protein
MPGAVALQDFTLFPPIPAQFDLAQSIRDAGILGSFDPDVPQSGAFRAFRQERHAFSRGPSRPKAVWARARTGISAMALCRSEARPFHGPAPSGSRTMPSCRWTPVKAVDAGPDRLNCPASCGMSDDREQRFFSMQPFRSGRPLFASDQRRREVHEPWCSHDIPPGGGRSAFGAGFRTHLRMRRCSRWRVAARTYAGTVTWLDRSRTNSCGCRLTAVDQRGLGHGR